jgi:Predicted Zn-dependent protease (DUF2268)
MAKEINDNETGQITDIVPENELDNLFTELTKDKKDRKQSTFYLYWLFGFPVKTCADKAGYAESYGYKLVEKYKKLSKTRHTVDEILNMFPERYKSVCKLRLPQIAQIEGKGLQEYENNPRLVIDKPQLLKQIKQGAGALQDDGHPKLNFSLFAVNARNLMIEMDTGAKTITDDNITDAELIDTDTR